jgi:cellulose synthase/poly-beta-1,6-N-acetylglucosamine synthase-like glycosyltransferase
MAYGTSVPKLFLCCNVLYPLAIENICERSAPICAVKKYLHALVGASLYMGITLLTLYVVCLLCIFAYSLAQGQLTYSYKKATQEPRTLPALPTQLPMVTIQLPLYNEPLVAERLIGKVALFDWPKERLEIQVLDDSTDETVQIVAKLVAQLRAQGFDIHHLQRAQRTGYKAGALAYGTALCKGEFVAIFDADFLPESDFLKQTIGHFADASVGTVQVRWAHLNRNDNLMTRLLALTLDAHFTIEQLGRSAGGNFINFNGTAGVWRKACIADAGGWSADTLTEDLDLSYRAQLRGWKIHYLANYAAPAEIPMLMPAIRSQQYRWNKGGAEVARKHLVGVLRSVQPLHVKLHAVFHLLNTAIFLCILLAAVVSVPLLYWLNGSALREPFLIVGIALFSGSTVLAYAFWTTLRTSVDNPWQAVGQFIYLFPLFLAVSMGLSLMNSIAVLEGYMGKRTPFVRTPKFASIGANLQSMPTRWGIPPRIAWAEAALALYFASGIILSLRLGYHPFLLFHVLLVVGFSTLVFYASKHAKANH